MMLNVPVSTIRRARRDEIPAIVDLTAAALRGFRGMVPDKALGLYIDYSCDVAGRWDRGDVLVVESDDRIAGTVTHAVCGDDDALPSGWAMVRALMVHPDARGRRLGRLLVGHCIASTRENGASTIGLHTSAFMRAASRIYRDFGFSRCPAHDFFASSMFGFDPAEGDILVAAYRLDL